MSTGEGDSIGQGVEGKLVTAVENEGCIDRIGVCMGGESEVIHCSEGDRVVEQYKEGQKRGEEEHKLDIMDVCQSKSEGMIMALVEDRQTTMPVVESTKKENVSQDEGVVHTGRVPLADCTNCLWSTQGEYGATVHRKALRDSGKGVPVNR